MYFNNKNPENFEIKLWIFKKRHFNFKGFSQNFLVVKHVIHDTQNKCIKWQALFPGKMRGIFYWYGESFVVCCCILMIMLRFLQCHMKAIKIENFMIFCVREFEEIDFWRNLKRFLLLINCMVLTNVQIESFRVSFVIKFLYLKRLNLMLLCFNIFYRLPFPGFHYFCCLVCALCDFLCFL